MKPYIYIGVFNNGVCLYRIGNKVINTPATIALLNWLIDGIEKHYNPIGAEYIAFDYTD